VLGRQRHAVHLVCQERLTRTELLERDASLVELLHATFDSSVEAGEDSIGRALAHTRLVEERGDRNAAPERGTDRLEQPRLALDVGLELRSAVPRALHGHRDLARRPRTEIVEGERERSLHEAADLQSPGGRVDLGDVVVDEEVVEPDRGEVPPEGLERHPVVPGRELELGEADLSCHPWTVAQSYVPSTFTARAATSRTVTAERREPRPMSRFA
jgi:hypothetical protein